MSGGQDEASERISTSDLPYWLAGPIKRLEARVERLEEARQQPAIGQPAKRREWWVHIRKSDGAISISAKEPATTDPAWDDIRVIAAPSEAEIEEAVEYGCKHHAAWGVTTGQSGSIRAAIRKLLGGGE